MERQLSKQEAELFKSVQSDEILVLVHSDWASVLLIKHHLKAEKLQVSHHFWEQLSQMLKL